MPTRRLTKGAWIPTLIAFLLGTACVATVWQIANIASISTTELEGVDYVSSNTAQAPVGYTSALPESADSAESSAYAMAEAIEEHQGRRRLSTSNINSQASQDQPYSSSVAESAPTNDALINSWANSAFQRSSDKQVARAHETKLAEMPAQVDDMGNPTHYDRVSYLAASKSASTRSLGHSTTVREEPAPHDARAWGWAVDALQNHRFAVQRAKFMGASPSSPKSQPVLPIHPALPTARVITSQADAKVRRMYKLKAARRAMEDVHVTTQSDENAAFLKDQAEESFRAKEIALQAKAEEDSADEGASAEMTEYTKVLG